ncbi:MULTISPECIES: ABC transporter substrate-binding protein [unclassified Rhizobium]|uniref:ABC transporter substrate-binding protein n=1 Tax=unclassified Rhizobium TaxID=2613769 RepID=UPI0024785962|nr:MULTISPECIES: ABC transporter substrate-binding protein [unclassified Rhizobium]MDH7804570.1 branched-chain amino acid transport system substrate-binding protein [Rhizobium sp. AN70]
MKSMTLALAAAALLSVSIPVKAEVLVGAVLPLSGVNARGGEDQRRGIELAVKEINAKGGVLGEPLKIIYEDSGNTSQRAIDAARKLVSVDKVSIVIGEYSSGITIPLGQFLVAEGVPHLNPASTSGLVRGIGATSFSMVGLDNVSTEFAAKDVLAHGWKKVAVLAMNNAFGQGVAQEFGKNFKSIGGEITTTIMYTSGQTSYRRELQQAESSQPDAYVFTAYGADGGLMMQEAHELGLQDEKPWYSVLVTMHNRDTPAEFKQGLIGMDVDYTAGGDNTYKADYETAYGEPFASAWSGYAHDTALFAAAAINKAGSKDRGAILAAIAALGNEGFTGVTGEIKLDSDGQRLWQPYQKLKVEGDDLVRYE